LIPKKKKKKEEKEGIHLPLGLKRPTSLYSRGYQETQDGGRRERERKKGEEEQERRKKGRKEDDGVLQRNESDGLERERVKKERSRYFKGV
jgi:hypothetical protein